ncbi:pyrimidine utilization protein D [Herbaspirillum lusitanum]|uniref:Putative carbamate hydrolase RutD n=1 Tax=Herbaspirillum lusitanum TaxID=213312 RepID=A0ABW9AE74_9BURK
MRSATVNGLTYDVHDPHDLRADQCAVPTVLLSSGLGGAAGYWQAQWPALLAAGYRVIVYDHRGTGRSKGALPQPYSIADMMQDVIDILDHSGTASCHMAGHALGGLVALQLALSAPQRIDSLLLINAWARVAAHTQRCFAARLALLDACGARAYVEAQPLFLYPAAWSEAHLAQISAEVEHACAHFPGADVLHARVAALKAFDVEQRLGEISVPVWLAASRDDVLVPWTASQRLADRLPNASLELSPAGGHAHNVTCADAFNRSMLAFLAALDSSRQATAGVRSC